MLASQRINLAEGACRAMKVLLVDVDSKIPNLALMKLSAYHKAHGDEVSFDVQDPDRVYVSIIYRRNLWRGPAIAAMYAEAEVQIGGTFGGVDLPHDIEFLKPDYELYPSTYSMGFTTRGCIRSCPWCVVPQKEGSLQRWQHPQDFVDPRFDTVMLLDNNWLADTDWFFETSLWFIEHNLAVDVTQGFDIRLVTQDVAHQLRWLRTKHGYHFAFDTESVMPIIRDKLHLLRWAGLDLRHEVQFYVYIDSDADFDSGLRRCQLLRDWGTNAFVMFNCDQHRTQRIKDLQRWANRKWLFWGVPFENYATQEPAAP
jgi:hypothetical protein